MKTGPTQAFVILNSLLLILPNEKKKRQVLNYFRFGGRNCLFRRSRVVSHSNASFTPELCKIQTVSPQANGQVHSITITITITGTYPLRALIGNTRLSRALILSAILLKISLMSSTSNLSSLSCLFASISIGKPSISSLVMMFPKRRQN